ncbi:glucokinase [Aquabacterium sp.]|uniref:glucokinase n=1 Tax=Aquabacterium sp. TaxID=1872578 RepID=UPI003784C7E5
MTRYDSPRLLADIGGTYARFVLELAPGHLEHAASLRCADHADFHAAVSAYLKTLPPAPLRHAAVAIANPVEGDLVRMTNYHWQFSIEQMRERLQLDTLVVVNDFTALAMAVPRLAAPDRHQVGGGQPREGSVIGVLGAGSGLGVSGLIPAAAGWVALGTEGGHTSFAPHDEREIAILRHAWRQYPHVSFERLLSGPGLELIHHALAEMAGKPEAGALPAPEITRRGLDGSDALCAEAIEVFCAMLGTAASNLAVSLGAFGGIYIGGGIVPRLGAYFERSPFRARFEDKGRFSDYLRAIPTFVITADNATFAGASAILQQQLRSIEAAPASALLAQIQRGLEGLSPAERRVADHVLAQPRSVLNEPIADIAKAASVSQPTVIRFCRSLGCEGLSDFKLRLASGLTGTVPVTHAQVTGADSMVELGAKVLDNSAAAILQLRDQLNRDTIDRAIELLNAARRIELHAVGHYAPVAIDAQFKFLRFGIPCNAHTDARLQLLSAAVLQPGDVVLIISASGRIQELIEVADTAHERGARVLAITASQSPLARKADIALIVDHPEDANTQLPMISRILHLLVIDILAVGVSMRREAGDAAAHAQTSAHPPQLPGVSASLPYARLTSHGQG